MASILEKVGKHAERIDAIANDLAANSIGGHPTRGHVARLRSISAGLRTDAAAGRVPFEHNFDVGPNYYAAEEVKFPPQVLRSLQASNLPTDGTKITLEQFDAAMASLPVGERLQAKQALLQAGRLSA